MSAGERLRPLCKEGDADLGFLVSVVAGIFGFTGMAAGVQAVAKILFGIFLVLFLIVLAFGVLAGRALF